MPLVLALVLSAAGCDPEGAKSVPPESAPATTTTAPAEATLVGTLPAPAADPTPLLTVTPRAAQEVKRIIGEMQEPGKLYLRLRIVGSGCTGFQHKLDLDPVTDDGDLRMETQGLTVVVDRKSALYVSGATVDFVSEPNSRGFIVTTPAAKGQCQKAP